MFKVNGVEVDIEYTSEEENNSFRWKIKSKDSSIDYYSDYGVDFVYACRIFGRAVIERDKKKKQKEEGRDRILRKFFNENCCMNCEFLTIGNNYCRCLGKKIENAPYFFCYNHQKYRKIIEE